MEKEALDNILRGMREAAEQAQQQPVTTQSLAMDTVSEGTPLTLEQLPEVLAQLARTQHVIAQESASVTERQRVGRQTKGTETSDRNEAIWQVSSALLRGELSQGEALKTLRMQVLALKQHDFAKLVHASRKTISDLENDRGNYSMQVINRVFAPFGLRLGIVPTSPEMLKKLL